MNNLFLWLIAGVLFLGFIFVISKLIFVSKPETGGSSLTRKVVIKGETYDLEIANTPQTRAYGLMNRKSMPENHGMIFIFDSLGIYPFWMKDTYIALDIIWLDAQGNVVFIKENAEPCSTIVGAICSGIIPGIKPAKYVIELNAGQIKKLDLKNGDNINLNF